MVNKWGYEEMSDSQIIMQAQLETMNIVRSLYSQMIGGFSTFEPFPEMYAIKRELERRAGEDRSHVPLSKRLKEAE